MTNASRSGELTREGLSFLQYRVALFGLLVSATGFFFLAVRAALVFVLHAYYHEFVHPSFILHALAALSFLAIWLLCRSGTRSCRFIEVAETLGLVAGCFFYIWMGTYIPALARPDLIVLLALTYGLVARAALVPSSGLRTLLLGVAVAVPAVVSTYFIFVDSDPALWSSFEPRMLERSPAYVATVFSVFAAAWWTLTVAVSAATSRVIYGLRRDVYDVRKLGQYTLEEKLGEGAMGMVYRASHAMLRRATAIKLLLQERAGERAVARFEREVQQTAGLTHPNTVTVFDYGRTPEGVFYYVMELLEGATLGEVVEVDGPQPPARVVHILEQVSGALAEAHGVGLIHRDIKPANIMLTERGGVPDVAKVLDFGLVKDIEQVEDVSLTQANTITGTPQFMSPESIRAPESMDARSDIYALGAVGYFLLAGQHVFGGKTVLEVCSAHLHSEPEPPSKRLGRALPTDLEGLLLDCLAKDRDRRPQSASELLERLRRCDGVSSWGLDEARAWWQRYGAVLRARHQRAASTASAETMAIDLDRRD